MINIQSNGSRGASSAPASIDELVQVLEKSPLDANFEQYGNFIMPAQNSEYSGRKNSEGNPEVINTGPMFPEAPDALVFWGNFLEVSHVFNIATDEENVIERLTTAIRANQASPAYIAQKKQAS